MYFDLRRDNSILKKITHKKITLVSPVIALENFKINAIKKKES